jgi:hypothetical protein
MKSILLKRFSLFYLLFLIISSTVLADANKQVTVPSDATYTGTYNYQGTRNGHPYYKHSTQNVYLYVDNYLGSWTLWLLANALVSNPDATVVKYYQWPDAYPTLGDPGSVQWYDITTDCSGGNCTQSITIADVVAGVAPTVSTDQASLVTTTAGTMNGNIVADGGATVSYGFTYSSTDATPTIGESGVTQVSIGTGTGIYSDYLGSLTPGEPIITRLME